MGRLAISNVSFKINGTAVTSVPYKSSVAISFDLENTSSYTDVRTMSVWVDWVDSNGTVVGSGYLLGSSKTSGVTITAHGEGKTKSYAYSFSDVTTACKIENGKQCTAVLYVYGWKYNSNSGTPYFSKSYTTNVQYIGEAHNLKIDSFSVYRSGGTSTVNYSFKVSRTQPATGQTYTLTDTYKLTVSTTSTPLKSGTLSAASASASGTNTQGTSVTATYTLTVSNSVESVSKTVTIGLPKTTLHLAPHANGGLGIGQYADKGSGTYGRLDVAYPTYFNGDVYGSPVCYKSGEYIEWTGSNNVAFGYITSTRSSLHCIVNVEKSLSKVSSFTVDSIKIGTVGTQALSWTAAWGTSTPKPTSVEKCNGNTALHFTWAFGSDKGSSNITNNETCQFRDITFKIKCS